MKDTVKEEEKVKEEVKEEVKAEEKVKVKEEEEGEKGFIAVLLLYGFLGAIIANIFRVYSNQGWAEASFWVAIASSLALIAVLKFVVGNMEKNNNNKNKKIMFFIMLSTWALVEMVTITLCTLAGVFIIFWFSTLKIVSSFSLLIMSGFIIIYGLYEFIVFASSNNFFLKKQLNNKYKELKKDFEEEYNMVNLLTIPATLLTLFILASGVKSEPEEILIKFFLSCSIIYVLLIHYCWKYRLNK